MHKIVKVGWKELMQKDAKVCWKGLYESCKEKSNWRGGANISATEVRKVEMNFAFAPLFEPFSYFLCIILAIPFYHSSHFITIHRFGTSCIPTLFCNLC